MLLLLTWLLVFALLGIPAAAAWMWLRRRGHDDERILFVGPLVFVGALGYAVFFVFFFSIAAGQLLAVAAPIGLGLYLHRARCDAPVGESVNPYVAPALLTFALGLFYLALLYLPQLGVSPEWQSVTRFLYPFPIDANLPLMLGDRLYTGESLRPFLADAGWLSSDRPPLQAGLYLLVRPWLGFFQLPVGLGYQCVGTLAQLFCVPALWLAARRLGCDGLRAAAVVLLVAASGFMLFNGTYVWPKLLSGGFVLLAGVLLLDRSVPRSPTILRLAAAAAALGWLAHGAAAFSLLALALVLLVPRYFPGWRSTLLALVVFTLFAAPWLAYQRGYDPPANRLMKWHLAGAVPVDGRSTWQALRDAYAAPRETLLRYKFDNFHVLFFGAYGPTLDLFTTPVRQRKVDEFFYVFRSLGILNLAWLLAPLTWLLRRRWPSHAGLHGILFAWTLLTLVVWCLLMYGPGTTFVHQGSYAMMLAFYLLAVAWLAGLPRWLAVPVLGWHALGFCFTWLPYFGSARLDPAMGGLLAVAAGILILAMRSAAGRPLPSAGPVRARLAAAAAALGAMPGKYPWRAALLTAAAVLLVLFLRRPEAFLHPQFWAEDGWVFFLQSELTGRGALVQPYNGYHHFLLRLVAAAAAGLDPLWIPAVYFWASIAVVLAVVLALFSPRLDLPRRPWLALALVLAPHSGEVFHNLTNAQWISAFALVLLLLARDARTAAQWVLDLAVAAIVGLTGVFSLLFLPLFLARAWVRRSAAAWVVAGVVLATAVVQAIALAASPVSIAPADGRLAPLVSVAGEHVWAALLLPRAVAGALSGGVLAGLGLIATALLVFTGWRRRERRFERIMLWGVAAALLTATLYKFRGNTDVLVDNNGDRYFFLPKVLVLWLVIFEWDGPHRRLARLVGLLALVASLTAFRFEPYINYDWPAWAARIRAGETVVVPINPAVSTFTYPGRPSAEKLPAPTSKLH